MLSRYCNHCFLNDIEFTFVLLFPNPNELELDVNCQKKNHDEHTNRKFISVIDVQSTLARNFWKPFGHHNFPMAQ
jgi:hypothetical protein